MSSFNLRDHYSTLHFSVYGEKSDCFECCKAGSTQKQRKVTVLTFKFSVAYKYVITRDGFSNVCSIMIRLSQVFKLMLVKWGSQPIKPKLLGFWPVSAMHSNLKINLSHIVYDIL